MTDIFTLGWGVLLELTTSGLLQSMKPKICTVPLATLTLPLPIFLCKMTELMVANQCYSCLKTTGKQSAQFFMILFTNSNPPISLVLAQRGYFKEQSFINYMKYLLYWKKPEYAKFLKWVLIRSNERPLSCLVLWVGERFFAKGADPKI